MDQDVDENYCKQTCLNQKNFDYIVVSPGINVHKCNLKKYLKKFSLGNPETLRTILVFLKKERYKKKKQNKRIQREKEL